jgi:hypothetical protein
MNKASFTIVALSASLAFSFNTKKQISAVSYQRLMIEHSLGVEVTMLYLLQRPEVLAVSDMQLLATHPDLVKTVAGHHDWAKINQRPDFLKRFSIESKVPFSEKLSQYYGVTLKLGNTDRSSLPVGEIENGLAVIQAVNQVDHGLFDESVDRYFRKARVPKQDQEPLYQALKRLERIADLTNRKMHETLLQQRFNLTAKPGSRFVFEFGHAFDLKTYNPNFWDNHPEDHSIAFNYSQSSTLMQLFMDAIQEKIVNNRLRYFSSKSPNRTCRRALSLN